MVGVEGQDAPDRPALTIVAERLAGDGNRLGPVGRARGHREHQHFGPLAEQGVRSPCRTRSMYGSVPVVAADRHPVAKIGRRADLAEVMVAAELAVGVLGDPAQQELVLDFAGPASLVEEGRAS